MRTKRIVFFLLLPLLVSAQSDFRKVGSSGYVFLTIPVGARTASLGEAAITLTDLGTEALFTNPSALGFQSFSQSVAFSYAPWIAETKHQAASYVYLAGDLGFFGLGIVQLDMGEIARYTDPRSEGGTSAPLYQYAGTFSADGIALGLTYGRRMTERFSFAVTAKFVQERIDVYRSNNFVFDGGMLYLTGFGSLRVAGVVRNFGLESKYEKALFKMPTDFRFGLAAEAFGDAESDHRLTLMTEFVHPTDNIERLNVGTEYCVLRMISLRAGYKFYTDEESWTAGVGVKWQMVALDAAYADYGRLGGITRITIGINL
jgi:hypothetical protein